MAAGLDVRVVSFSMVCMRFDGDDVATGVENREFDSPLASSVSFTISMEFTTLVFLLLNMERLIDSVSSLVNVIDSDGGILHDVNSDWTFFGDSLAPSMGRGGGIGFGPALTFWWLLMCAGLLLPFLPLPPPLPPLVFVIAFLARLVCFSVAANVFDCLALKLFNC